MTKTYLYIFIFSFFITVFMVVLDQNEQFSKKYPRVFPFLGLVSVATVGVSFCLLIISFLTC